MEEKEKACLKQAGLPETVVTLRNRIILGIANDDVIKEGNFHRLRRLPE